MSVAMKKAVGKDLNNLVKHLQSKLGGSGGSSASTSPSLYNELCLRTRVKAKALSDNKRPRPLLQSEWCLIMTVRYKEAQGKLVAQSAAMEEIQEVALSMFAGGCSWSSMGATVTTISSMLTESSLSDEELEAAAKKRAPRGKKNAVAAKASTQDILGVFGYVLESKLLSRWWEKDSYTAANKPQLLTLCMKDQPHPVLCLEYCVDGAANLKNTTVDDSTVFYREISLKGHLTATAPSVTALARHLADRYSFLLEDESKWSRLLSKLQRLMKQSVEAAKEAAANPKHADPAVEGATTTGAASSEQPTGPKKGDLSALFRDGESALKDVDLQDADELTVKEYKAKMDTGFEKNKLRPGDEGYNYDIRVEVKPTASSAWDDSDEDDDE